MNPTRPQLTAVRLGGSRGLPLLVLGPSLGTTARTLWSRCATHLVDSFEVLAWDLPGHGTNSGPAQAFDVAGLAAGVLDLVDDMLAERDEPGRSFAYAGDSVGGAVGLQLLLDAPDRMDGAVLLATGARIGDADSWGERAATVRSSGTAAVVEGSIERWFSTGFVQQQPEVAGALLDALRAADSEGYAQVCEALGAFDVRGRLPQVDRPVLAVAGSVDVATPPESLAEIAAGVRDGRLVVLDGVGHLPPAERPSDVANLIRDHLAESDDTGSGRPDLGARPRRGRSAATTPASYIYAAVRTPFARFGGAYAQIRPDDLAATALAGVLARTPGLDPALIEDVFWGNANGAGEDNRNVGRMAVLLAGLPTSVPATTVNRLCGSSLDAAIMASRAIETGDTDVVVAGGVESMTRAPWVLPKPSRAFPAGDLTAVSTTLGWRLVNEQMPAEWTVSLGESNEQLQEKFSIPRERQDAFATKSHQLADQAWRSGFYDDLTVAVPGAGLTRDESIRPETTTGTLAGLKPVFRSDGTITAGNASPLNDGASALVIGSEAAGATIGVDPIARIAGRAAHALDPQMFGYAPVQAAESALRRAGIDWSDIGAVELNEAFAVQSLACIDAWGVDPQIVNTRGGAIAIGHPLGASGARILGTLAHVLRERGERWGVAAMCIGVGQALAVVLENTAEG